MSDSVPGEVVVSHEAGDAVGFIEGLKKYLLPILYLTIFLFLYGENIQPAPRSQIYEQIICRRLHSDSNAGNIVLYNNICKEADIQEELAYLIGMERLLGIIPSNTSLAIFYPS